MRTLILSFLTLLLFSTLQATEGAEFGEVSPEELAMVSFADDPEADIVILFDRAEIEFDDYFNMTLKREIRIKILTEKGKENASVRIGYYYEDRLWDIEAYSYLPNGEEFEFDDDNIAEEQVKYTKFKKFDIPGVEVGSVIEYKYTLFSKYISNLEPWYFQSNAYTKLSQISFYLPPGFMYSTFNYNWSNYHITTSTEQVYKNAKQIPKYTWTATDIPAIKEEPYMRAKRDYYAKILFQLVSFKSPYVTRIFAKSWDDLAKNRSNGIEELLEESGDHHDFMEDYLKDEKSALDKAKKIYTYIRDNIITDYAPDRDLEDVFNDKKGSISEKNYLLMNLLKNAGLEVFPFMISTRDHGIVYENWPNMDQFNRTIACVTIDKKTYYLDANNKYCPFGYLPPDLDVGMGLKLMGEKAVITDLKPLNFKNEADYETEITINDDGSIEAQSKIEYQGYLAINERSQVNNSDDLEDHVNKKLEDYDVDAEIDTFYYANVDSLDKPVYLTIKYKLNDAAEINDNLIYMTIPFITGRKSNPFIRETRNFPVDYPYNYKTKEELLIHFPEGFNLSEKPKEVIKRLKKFNYSKIFLGGDNSLSCRRTFEIGKKRFDVNEYDKLKKAFDGIVESDQSIIVLEKMK